jgi:hypothetical protein
MTQTATDVIHKQVKTGQQQEKVIRTVFSHLKEATAMLRAVVVTLIALNIKSVQSVRSVILQKTQSYLPIEPSSIFIIVRIVIVYRVGQQ